MRRMLLALIIALSLWTPFSSAHAQEDTPNDLRVVYVTIQRNASLRAGPGTNWERLAVISFGTTLRATGRTLDANWIQVAYSGQRDTDAYPETLINGVTYGWIASELLIWTGSVLELTVDGVPTVDFARAVGRIILITPEQPIYVGLVGPTEQVAYPLEGAAYVEATGRLGEGENFQYWVQIKANGNFYWVSTVGFAPRNLPDASYLYSVGRLNITLSRNLSRLRQTLGDISARWSTLGSGAPTSCNNIPADLILPSFNEVDVNREPVYRALNTALTAAVASTQSAINRFREICASPTTPVTIETITLALDDVFDAQHYLNVISLLNEPLEGLDPYSGS